MTVSLINPVYMTLKKPQEATNQCQDILAETRVLLQPRSCLIMSGESRYRCWSLACNCTGFTAQRLAVCLCKSMNPQGHCPKRVLVTVLLSTFDAHVFVAFAVCSDLLLGLPVWVMQSQLLRSPGAHCFCRWRHGISKTKNVPLPDGTTVYRGVEYRRLSLTIRRVLDGRRRAEGDSAGWVRHLDPVRYDIP